MSTINTRCLIRAAVPNSLLPFSCAVGKGEGRVYCWEEAGWEEEGRQGVVFERDRVGRGEEGWWGKDARQGVVLRRGRMRRLKEVRCRGAGCGERKGDLTKCRVWGEERGAPYALQHSCSPLPWPTIDGPFNAPSLTLRWW